MRTGQLPVDVFIRRWKCQWISHILKNSDIFIYFSNKLTFVSALVLICFCVIILSNYHRFVCPSKVRSILGACEFNGFDLLFNLMHFVCFTSLPAVDVVYALTNFLEGSKRPLYQFSHRNKAASSS